MTIGPPPLCASCANLIAEDDLSLRCRAFPDGIPDEILDNEFDHRKPHPEDNGILYQPDGPGEPVFDPFRDERV